jgi:hypothetical protein
LIIFTRAEQEARKGYCGRIEQGLLTQPSDENMCFLEEVVPKSWGIIRS